VINEEAVILACKFCEIVAGTAPAERVYEDEFSLAFLDTKPLFHGHCLLVPKQHWVTLLELPEPEIGPLFLASQRVTAAVQKAMNAQGTFVAINNIVSQSVPHLHIHIVPRTKGDGLKGFFWPRTKYADEDHMTSVGEQIRSALARH
jgi:histidine triad (HIT) family protein